jgi:hypothetical protein
MVFNATFKNISVELWVSVLLVEETGETREKSKEDVSTVSVKSHSLQMIPGQEDSDDDGGYAGIDKNQC